MLSKSVQAQTFAVRILKGHLAQNRLAHAYLFTGEASSGKEDLALAFAADLNGEGADYFSGCNPLVMQRIAAGNHPDVKWIGLDPEVKSIKIEEIRDLLQSAHLKPFEGRRKVFIIQSAERMTVEAANALLKILEEPPVHTLFILLAHHKANLLTTIQSRSFEIRLRPLLAAIADADCMTIRIENNDWDGFLDSYRAKPRTDLIVMLEVLIKQFGQKLRLIAQDENEDSCGLLRALEAVIETKEAIDANSNQKLSLTRLAMRLRRSGAESL